MGFGGLPFGGSCGAPCGFPAPCAAPCAAPCGFPALSAAPFAAPCGGFGGLPFGGLPLGFGGRTISLRLNHLHLNSLEKFSKVVGHVTV